MINNVIFENSSFKDRAAQVVSYDGEIYRLIYDSGKADYDKLMTSDLYDFLVSNGKLVSHIECEKFVPVYKVIKPQKVFITYPYEWCFSQFKEAALLTLDIQEAALRYGMSLKDANAYNIQFFEGRPVFIDTTSFEIYKENSPWTAYNQFCRQFLAPLALMANKDLSLSFLLTKNLDGVDISLASKLLPVSSYMDLGILRHIHMHAKIQNTYADSDKKININFSKFQMESLIYDLKNCIKNLTIKKLNTEWGDYYANTNYSEKNFRQKQEILECFKNKIDSNFVVDLGANTGFFSRIFKDKAKLILSCDIDTQAVEENYFSIRKNNEKNVLPLVIDICNPTPALGWNGEERQSFFERVKNADVVLALAFIHHLAIGKNLPFEKIAQTFARLGNYLIIEFVEKNDSQIQKMLLNREDIFEDYTIENFENIFSRFYLIEDKVRLIDSSRILYLMRKK